MYQLVFPSPFYCSCNFFLIIILKNHFQYIENFNCSELTLQINIYIYNILYLYMGFMFVLILSYILANNEKFKENNPLLYNICIIINAIILFIIIIIITINIIELLFIIIICPFLNKKTSRNADFNNKVICIYFKIYLYIYFNNYINICRYFN